MKVNQSPKNPLLEQSLALWESALVRTTPDPGVGIRHAPLVGDSAYRTHVALIPERVGCHFHAQGDEDYQVVAGAGTLHWGKVTAGPAGHEVAWEKPLDVKTGDHFVIPEGYAHQLSRRGAAPLVIIFGCPDAHLADDQDRTLLRDAPGLTKGINLSSQPNP